MNCLLSSAPAMAIVLLLAVGDSGTHQPFTQTPGSGRVPERPDDPALPRAVRDTARGTRSRVFYNRGPYVSIQVNVDQDGLNIMGDAANEPSIAVSPLDPNRLAVGWRQFDTVASNFRQAGWAYSLNGGQIWTFPGVIDPGVFRSDPVLDTDADGNFYYFSLTTDGDIWEYDLFASATAAITWGPGVFAFGGDKGWMVVDRSSGAGNGNIYAKWQTFANCCGFNTFTRSTNGGQSFIDPVPVPLGPSFGTLAIGPDSEVYVAGIQAVTFQDFTTIVIARSSNAPDPLTLPQFELATEVPLGGALALGAGPNPAGLLGQVCVACDTSGGADHGNVYVLASVNPPGPDPLDVMISRSEDGGQTWSTAVRVNDDALAGNAWQWFGTLAVAPDGRLDVIWNDTRNSAAVNFSELFYAYSTDGGRTWSPNLPVSPVFDSYLGWPNQNKLGDYYDMVSSSARARIAYAATFNGEQDVYFLEVGDCNANGIHDAVDLDGGDSLDVDGNGLPDECQCTADLDGDELVGSADLATLLGAWGDNPAHPANLDGDSEVGPSDLAQLLGQWGPCVVFPAVCQSDAFPPAIFCPGDLTLNCDDSIDPPATGLPLVADDCDADPQLLFADVQNGDCPAEAFITRTWSATDSSNNSASCQQQLTLVPALPCGDPGSGSCCEAHATPGCEDQECCEQVCNFDPFCCEIAWDLTCVEETQLLGCPSCG